MKEKLYTIPVTDAFQANVECPICAMKNSLEADAIDYTIGPSYMEDDVRAETDKVGFCEKHIHMLYEKQNMLGFAMILKTHLDKTNKDIEQLQLNTDKLSSSLFSKKKIKTSDIKSYIDKLDTSCFVCDIINRTFNRYLLTVFHLYKNEADFRTLFFNSKGMCTHHYGLLYEQAPKYLKGNILNEFLKGLNKLYLDNMNRVKDELEWFIDKSDYRYVNEPWKNSKDALIRTLQKTNQVFIKSDQ